MSYAGLVVVASLVASWAVTTPALALPAPGAAPGIPASLASPCPPAALPRSLDAR
jgi:hypothetical protein